MTTSSASALSGAEQQQEPQQRTVARGGGDVAFLGACATALGFLILLAWPMLRNWYWEFTRPDSYYAHGFFVPVLSGVMLWHGRERLRSVAKHPSWGALALLAPLLALHVFAQKNYMPAMMAWSFLAIVACSVWLVGGGALTRAAAFPLGFLWLMAPLPGPLLNDATLKMQISSTIVAAKILPLVGFSAVREGNLIHLENYLLNVDVPCSGFNLLLRLLTFSLAFASLTDGPWLRRAGIFVFSLPLSLVINAVRIASIGIVGECLGARAALTFHDWGGLLSLVLCMTLLFGFAKAMGCKTFAGQPIF